MPEIADTAWHTARLFGSDTPANRKRLYRMFKEGAPHMKIGGTLYARPERIDEWLAAQESASSEMEAA